MSDLSFVTAFYEAASRNARAATFEKDRERGLEEGRRGAREEWLTVMLRRRFGADPRILEVARRLAILDVDDGVGRCLRATSIDDLAGTD